MSAIFNGLGKGKRPLERPGDAIMSQFITFAVDFLPQRCSKTPIDTINGRISQATQEKGLSAAQDDELLRCLKEMPSSASPSNTRSFKIVQLRIGHCPDLLSSNLPTQLRLQVYERVPLEVRFNRLFPGQEASRGYKEQIFDQAISPFTIVLKTENDICASLYANHLCAMGNVQLCPLDWSLQGLLDIR